MGNCLGPSGSARGTGNNPSTAVFHERYKQERKQLGEGRAGHVFRCTERSTNKIFACKNISKKDQSVIECRREVMILNRLKGSKYIIQLKEVFEDNRHLFLVTELCAGGELYDQIVARSESVEGRFSEAETAIMMRQLLGAVEACHNLHQITHRDLKPENFLLKNRDDISQIRLIDFGLSRFYQPDERLRTRVGTVYYTAPEVWSENYDYTCDLWSAGVIMYVLLCSYPPFDGDSDKDILRTVCRGKYAFPQDDWGSISNEAKNLIRKLLSKNPRRRPSATEALADPWFEKFGAAVTSEDEDDVDLDDDDDVGERDRLKRNSSAMVTTADESTELTEKDLLFAQVGSNASSGGRGSMGDEDDGEEPELAEGGGSFKSPSGAARSGGSGNGSRAAEAEAAAASARKLKEAKAKAARAKAAAARQRQEEALQRKADGGSKSPGSGGDLPAPPPPQQRQKPSSPRARPSSPRASSRQGSAGPPASPPKTPNTPPLEKDGAEEEEDEDGWAPVTNIASSVSGSITSVGATMGLY